MGTPPDAGRHNSGLDDSRPDRCFDAADGPDPINGSQMVFMPMRHDATCRMSIAEGRSVEIDFHIMSGQRIPTEQDMDEFFIDEPCQRLAPSGVNNRRASRQQYLAARFPLSEPCSQLHEALGDVADNMPVRTLGRDLRFHEAEYIAVTWPLKRDHPHALTTSHNQISTLNLSHWDGAGSQAHWVHTNAQVHLDPLHLHPLVTHSHLGV